MPGRPARPAAAAAAAPAPLGVMVILLAYTLCSLPLAYPAPARPGLLALAVTAGRHLWRRNAVLSILGGTAVHILLTSAS